MALDLANMTVKQFIDATAAAQPTPGGGSVAGVVGALGSGSGRDGPGLHPRQEGVRPARGRFRGHRRPAGQRRGRRSKS